MALRSLSSACASSPTYPRGAVDYPLVELMRRGAARGHGRFNLGMTACADLGSHPLAPAWQRLGTLIYRYGEHFPDPGAVRTYKSRFAPTWRPKNVAVPLGFTVPAVLLDVAALIEGDVPAPGVR